MSAARNCKHARGDYVPELGFWVCADCYVKLEKRPVRYGPNPDYVVGGEPWSVPPQIIVWQAEIAQADGLTFGEFLRAMTRRYMMRTRPKISTPDAYDAAIECVRGLLPDRYGDSAYGWDQACAWEFADDDMDNWDMNEQSNG